MNKFTLALAVALGATTAFAQQAETSAPQQPRCPDYSLQLAQGVQAFSDRDSWRVQAMQLDAQVTSLKKQVKEAEEKVTANDVIVDSLRKQLKEATGKKAEAAPAVPAPAKEDGK